MQEVLIHTRDKRFTLQERIIIGQKAADTVKFAPLRQAILTCAHCIWVTLIKNSKGQADLSCYKHHLPQNDAPKCPDNTPFGTTGI
jgi:hypothetical protein